MPVDLSRLRRGVTSVQEKAAEGGARKGKAGGFVPFFRLKAGESAFVQFITPLDDSDDAVVEVPIYTYVNVPVEKDGKIEEWKQSFVSREVIGEHDFLGEDLGLTPDLKYAGVGVLLDPVYKKGSRGTRVTDIERFEVQYREWDNNDGQTMKFPVWNFFYYSPNNFWSTLINVDTHQADVATTPIQVVREGSGPRDTKYFFNPVTAAEPIDWEEWEGTIPTVGTVIEQLVSDEHYNKFFNDDLPVLAQTGFNAKKETTKEEKASTSSKRRVSISELKEMVNDNTNSEDQEEDAVPY